MTTPMLFRLSRWAIGACIAVEVLAMLVYPGGTVRDPGATRYSFSQNFISDLGMTVTHGGHPNRLGAGLFTVGFTALSFAVIACALGFVRLHGSSLRGRQVSRVAAAGGMLAGACLLGTAVSPANLAAPLHSKGFIPPADWHEIEWEIRLDRMRVIVDGEVRFDAPGDYSGIESAPSVGPCFGSTISIREFSITSMA